MAKKLNFNKIFPLALICLLLILLRLPSLFEPNRYADEDIYLTLGLAFRRGLVFYRDIHDNKPPLLYLFAAFAGTVPRFRFILLLWHLVNTCLYYFLAQKLLKKSWVYIPIVILFVVLSTIPLLEGNISNGEIFMIMPATAAVFLFFHPRPRLFLVGLFFSFAFLFKVPVFFDFLALILFFLLFSPPRFNLKKLFSPSFLSLCFGFVLPILITIIYYSLLGAGRPYIISALLQNIGYLSSWEGSTPFYQSGLFIRFLILFFLFFLIYLFRSRLPSFFIFVCLWFIFALFGSLLSGRPYPHYFIQLLPSFCLLLGFLLAPISKITKSLGLFLLSLAPLSFFFYHFWFYPSLPYYRNFLKYHLGLINQNQFFQFWGDSVLVNYQIAQFIKNYTTPDQKIFVWGTQPAVYALSGRLPVGRYTVAYHIADFNAFSSTIDSLRQNPPPFIIYFPNNPPFPQLDEFIQQNYSPQKVIPPAIIFQYHSYEPSS